MALRLFVTSVIICVYQDTPNKNRPTMTEQAMSLALNVFAVSRLVSVTMFIHFMNSHMIARKVRLNIMEFLMTSRRTSPIGIPQTMYVLPYSIATPTMVSLRLLIAPMAFEKKLPELE